jgi:long-chain fatty acid transport protein
MRYRAVAKAALVLLACCSLGNAAMAGGIERGGYDIDLLFDQSRYAFEGGIAYVIPDRKLTHVHDVDGSLDSRPHTASDGPTFGVPYLGFKIGITDDVDCLADYSEPFGAHSDPGQNWAGANYAVEEKISTHNYGLTCSYKFDAGPGQLRLIGGGFYQEVLGYKEELVAQIPAPYSAVYDGMGRLDLADHGWGWRSGVAYEIPEYAMRASLVYNSQVKYDGLSGSVDLTGVPSFAYPGNAAVGTTTPVYGSATAPDSLELKLQTGIAPDWLAFGSVKWTNWSTLQSVAFCPTSTRGVIACRSGSAAELSSLDLLYRDGWTLSGGIGHKFNAQWSGAVSLTWDEGTSQGYGMSSDTWTLGAGLSFSPTEHIEYRLAGAVGVLTAGKSGTVTSDGVTYGDDVTYSYGRDFFGAVSTSVKLKF